MDYRDLLDLEIDNSAGAERERERSSARFLRSIKDRAVVEPAFVVNDDAVAGFE